MPAASGCITSRPESSDRNLRASSFLCLRFPCGFLSVDIPTSSLKLGMGFGPVTNGLEVSPTGSKDSQIRGPCHHASDRRYRSHVYLRAHGANEGLGYSLPNRIPDQSRKGDLLEASFWVPPMPQDMSSKLTSKSKAPRICISIPAILPEALPTLASGPTSGSWSMRALEIMCSLRGERLSAAQHPVGDNPTWNAKKDSGPPR